MTKTLDLTDEEVNARLAEFPAEALTTPCEVPNHAIGGVTNSCAPAESARWQLLIFHGAGRGPDLKCNEPVSLLVCDSFLRAIQTSPAPETCVTCKAVQLTPADWYTLVGEIR